MNLITILTLANNLQASDVHLVSKAVPWLRINGLLGPLDQAPILSREELSSMLLAIMDEKLQAALIKELAVDFAYTIPDVARFRVNVFWEKKGIAAVFRIIPATILSLAALQLPKVVEELALFENGLVLVTGPTGSGKTTTLASMVDFINQHTSRHIITIEDPVEFIHQNKQSLITQREVGRDTLSFSSALRAALREDPDVLLIGELRDLETIRLALTAAETGHLVLGTLHTVSAPKAVTRITDVFPGNEQALVRTMLADSLKAVIAQMLCKNKAGARVVATEIMITTPAIANLMRENKIAQLKSQIQTGAAYGMHTLEQDLERLAALR